MVWNYDAPAGHEVHTALPIGNDRVLYIQNGDPALLRVVNIVTGATEKEMALKTMQPSSTHAQFRHARLTAQGTLLVAHHDLNKVVEYDSNGNELWSFPGDGPWGVTPLANGNVLITDHQGVREITRRGDAVWSWKPADSPATSFQTCNRLGGCRTGTRYQQLGERMERRTRRDMAGTLQAIEVTPAKQVVWALASPGPTPPTWDRRRRSSFWMSPPRRRMCISGRSSKRRMCRVGSQGQSRDLGAQLQFFCRTSSSARRRLRRSAHGPRRWSRSPSISTTRSGSRAAIS